MADVENEVHEDVEEQLVVFTLGNELYGVNIEAVNTIIRIPEITQVPHTPDYVDGVMNLRGVIVPVIDLRRRFSLPTTETTKASRIIVVEEQGMLVGMVVDTVVETRRLPSSSIEALSPLVVSVDSRYLRGVGKVDDRLIILLALDRVLGETEKAELESAVPAQA